MTYSIFFSFFFSLSISISNINIFPEKEIEIKKFDKSFSSSSPTKGTSSPSYQQKETNISAVEQNEKSLSFSQSPQPDGKKLFSLHCLACHQDGNNIIIPEKNLRPETLEANGMRSKVAISYQIQNGKNGMPAFGGRLTDSEIEKIANYVLQMFLSSP